MLKGIGKKFIVTLIIVVMMTACGSQGDQSVTKNVDEGKVETEVKNDGANASGVEESTEEALEYPTENILITVPFGAGGKADVIARQIATLAENKFGVPVLVENMVGAGGILAATDYMHEKPNTHRLLFTSRAMVATMPLVQEVTYTADDFIPVIGIENMNFILYVNPKNTGINTIEDLEAFAKENGVKYGSLGPGTDLAVIQRGLFQLMEVEATPVVFSSAVEAINNVIAGNVDVMVATHSLGKGHIATGDLEALAAFDDKSFEGYDGVSVPAITEFGYDIVFPSLNFFSISKGTDSEVVEYINGVLAEVYKEPQFIELVEKMEIDLNTWSSDEITDYIAQQKEIVIGIIGE